MQLFKGCADADALRGTNGNDYLINPCINTIVEGITREHNTILFLFHLIIYLKPAKINEI